MLSFLFMFASDVELELKANQKEEAQVSYNTVVYKPYDIKDKTVFNEWTSAIKLTINSR